MRNLQHFDPEVTHERFVDAVVSAFRSEYGVEEEVTTSARYARSVTDNSPVMLQVQTIEEHNAVTSIEYIRQGMTELPVRLIINFPPMLYNDRGNGRAGTGHSAKPQSSRRG